MKRNLLLFTVVWIVLVLASIATAQSYYPAPPPPPPGMSQPADNVCFYTQPYYQGQSYCAAPGINTPDISRIMLNNRPENWQGRIISIQLIGNAKVTVWNGRNFTGTWLKLNQSQPDLRQVNTTQGFYNWANQIMSYTVHW